MGAVAAGLVPVDETFEDIMSFCLGCRACEAACPSLVPYGRAIEGTRAEIAAQRPQQRRRLRHWVFTRVLGTAWMMRLATSLVAIGQRLGAARIRRGPRSVGCRGCAGSRSGRVAFAAPRPVPPADGGRWRCSPAA